MVTVENTLALNLFFRKTKDASALENNGHTDVFRDGVWGAACSNKHVPFEHYFAHTGFANAVMTIRNRHPCRMDQVKLLVMVFGTQPGRNMLVVTVLASSFLNKLYEESAALESANAEVSHGGVWGAACSNKHGFKFGSFEY